MAVGDEKNPSSELWQAAAATSPGRTVLLLGVGFDPRSMVVLQKLLSDAPSELTIVRIDLPSPSPSSDPVTRTLASDNLAAFEETTEGLDVRVIPFPSVHERINAGPRIAQKVSSAEFLDDCGHVLLDISSLPSTVYFPILKALLQACDISSGDAAHFGGELQVVACENPEVDAAIKDHGVSDAEIVGGFRKGLDQESQQNGVIVWVPTLGENCREALEAIHSFLDPKDTTPVLPFPARWPRRADDLILEHHVELFDRFRVTTSNIIYADERNPFDLYRTLCRLNRDYHQALKPLGTPTLALSAHSSKLLSIGVLLAAYENDLPILAAPAKDYALDEEVNLDKVSVFNRVASLWLSGAPYA